jgi:hypothetical protein
MASSDHRKISTLGLTARFTLTDTVFVENAMQSRHSLRCVQTVWSVSLRYDNNIHVARVLACTEKYRIRISSSRPLFRLQNSTS